MAETGTPCGPTICDGWGRYRASSADGSGVSVGVDCSGSGSKVKVEPTMTGPGCMPKWGGGRADVWEETGSAAKVKVGRWCMPLSSVGMDKDVGAGEPMGGVGMMRSRSAGAAVTSTGEGPLTGMGESVCPCGCTCWRPTRMLPASTESMLRAAAMKEGIGRGMVGWRSAAGATGAAWTAWQESRTAAEMRVHFILMMCCVVLVVELEEIFPWKNVGEERI